MEGLDPSGPMRENAARIVGVRAAELFELAERAIAESDQTALHDSRIAAKRLRYVLEVTAFCFDPDAVEIARKMRELQDLLGELHDCDVLVPRVEAHIAQLRTADALAAAAAQPGPGELEWDAIDKAPNSGAYAGLARLELYVAARRARLYGDFVAFWESLGRDAFLERVERATGTASHSRRRDLGNRSIA